MSDPVVVMRDFSHLPAASTLAPCAQHLSREYMERIHRDTLAFLAEQGCTIDLTAEPLKEEER